MTLEIAKKEVYGQKCISSKHKIALNLNCSNKNILQYFTKSGF